MKEFKFMPFKMFLEREHKDNISMDGNDRDLDEPAWKNR